MPHNDLELTVARAAGGIDKGLLLDRNGGTSRKPKEKWYLNESDYVDDVKNIPSEDSHQGQPKHQWWERLDHIRCPQYPIASSTSNAWSLREVPRPDSDARSEQQTNASPHRSNDQIDAGRPRLCD